MSESTEQNQAVEAQAQAGVPDQSAELLQRIQLLEANNAKLLDEKKATAKTNEDLQRKLSERKQADLIEKEDYKGLHADLKASYDLKCKELETKSAELEQVKVERQQDQIRASATNLFAQNGVNAPEHLMKILGEHLRLDENGAVAILAGGVQVPLHTHIQNLKTPGSGYEMFFSGSQARGMSAVGSTSNAAGQNSWESMSFSEQLALEVQDPEAAARLKAQG